MGQHFRLNIFNKGHIVNGSYNLTEYAKGKTTSIPIIQLIVSA